MGFPIRKSSDQSLFAAPRSLSQRITSFIASYCQGIHRAPLRHLIVPIIDARHGCGVTGDNGSKKTSLLRYTQIATRSALTNLAAVSGYGNPRRIFLTMTNSRQIFRRTSCKDEKTNDQPLSWWSLSGSNRRPEACKATALPAELRPRSKRLVGLGRLELPTSRLSSARSNQLSYKPDPPIGPHTGSFEEKEKRGRRCSAKCDLT